MGWVAGVVTRCSVRSGATGAGGGAFASVFASLLVSAGVLAACNAGTCGALLIIGTVPLLSASVHLSVSSPPALAKGSVGLVAGSGDFFSSRAVSMCFAGSARFSVTFSGAVGAG